MESRNGKVETLPRNFPACDVKHAADFLLSILRTMLFPTIKYCSVINRFKNHLIIAGSSSYLEFIVGIKSIIK